MLDTAPLNFAGVSRATVVLSACIAASIHSIRRREKCRSKRLSNQIRDTTSPPSPSSISNPSGRIEIFLKPSINVICGPNGTQDANTLDAIIFALAQEQSVLRITSWAELANRSNRGPCAVRLTITETNKGSDDLVLLAHAKADGTRTFKVNGVNATTQKVKEELQTVGLNAGSSAFAVRQHAAMKELTASGLTAPRANERRGAVEAQHRERAAAARQGEGDADEVASDIQELEQIFAKEREAKSSAHPAGLTASP